MYDARSIANEVLKRAWSEGLALTQIDVQKILYFLNGHYLIHYGKPLINSNFEAWEYGPVQRVVYKAFKHFGDQPIDELAVGFDPVRRVQKELPTVNNNTAIDIIEEYLPRYLATPSFDMVRMTHEEGTPWSITVKNAETTINVGMRIKNDIIAANFEGLVSN